MKAPFPYFGGKSRVADLVWAALGDPKHYVEPFAGSAAVLLARPGCNRSRIETIGDKDAFVANFWRAVAHDPEGVASWADWPCIEHDLHARHAVLVEGADRLSERIEGDPDFYDVRVAGWWVWGACLWIGSGWCSGKGPWVRRCGRLVKRTGEGSSVSRQKPHLGNAGRGIHRSLSGGVSRKKPHLGDAGCGIHRYVAVTDDEDVTTCELWGDHLQSVMRALQDRLRRVRVVGGDWSRCATPAVLRQGGITGVLLDPPYAHEGRDAGVYAHEMTTADSVREWAITHGDDPTLRIVLCGYENEHAMPDTWTEVRWTSRSGYSVGSEEGSRSRINRMRETLFFSPHCLPIPRHLPAHATMIHRAPAHQCPDPITQLALAPESPIPERGDAA